MVTIFELIISGIFLASIYILLGLGISILYGVSQTINLAQGDFMILGAYLTFVSVSYIGIPPIWLLIIVPFLLAFLAMILYKGGGFSSILNRPIPREDREYTTLIMTFGLSWILSNLLAWVFTANYQTFASPAGSLIIGELRIPFRKIISISISYSFVAAVWIFIKNTWIGLSIRCVFDDNEATKLMGVNIEKVHLIIFFLAFFSAGLGGVLYSMNFAMNPYLGAELTILAIVVTIIGGIGSVKGVMIAGTIVGVSEAFIMFLISPLLKIAFVYSLFIAILLFKPSGLFKRM